MSDNAPPHHPSEGEAHAFERRWIAMIVLLMASFMNMIDVTIVNVALPSMQKNLGVSESGIEWVVAGYILAFALGLLPFGRYGDIVGKKRIFLIGVIAFTLASLLCGLALNVEMLIAARVIQGVAGAVMTPQVLALAQIMARARWCWADHDSPIRLVRISHIGTEPPASASASPNARLTALEAWASWSPIGVPWGFTRVLASVGY